MSMSNIICILDLKGSKKMHHYLSPSDIPNLDVKKLIWISNIIVWSGSIIANWSQGAIGADPQLLLTLKVVLSVGIKRSVSPLSCMTDYMV